MEDLHYYALTDLNIEYLGIDVGLEVLQKAVGGWIEALPAQQMWEVAYVDEEGRLKGLPVNQLASGFQWLLGLNLNHCKKLSLIRNKRMEPPKHSGLVQISRNLLQQSSCFFFQQFSSFFKL